MIIKAKATKPLSNIMYKNQIFKVVFGVKEAIRGRVFN